MKPPFKVLIAVPTRGTCASGFAHDLALMMSYTIATMSPSVFSGLELAMQPGTLICDQRHQLSRRAVLEEFTHILWLDDDMRFPPDTLVRLLAHNKPVVAASYSTRTVPAHPTAMTFPHLGAQPEFVYSDDPKQTGLQQVDAVGMGVMLMQVPETFAKADPPWFVIEWAEDKSASGYHGEDVFMCNKLMNEGVPVLIDHDLSREVGHLGEFTYTHKHAATWRVRFGDEVAR